MFITHKKGLEARRQQSDAALRLRRLQHLAHAELFRREPGVAGDGRRATRSPNLRGGGEYGEDWHEAGTKLNKQNVFDDFIAAAEWLIANKYTVHDEARDRRRQQRRPAGRRVHDAAARSVRRGAARGRRDGHAALPQVHHRLGLGERLRLGGRRGEVHRPARYSPYHNLKPGTHYPATLVTTADHDDRVVPAHSFKFAAALQADQAGPAPVLIRIETKSGHGAAGPPRRSSRSRPIAGRSCGASSG